MTLEDVPTDYIRRKKQATCADEVWEQYDEVFGFDGRRRGPPRKTSPKGVEYPTGWTSYWAKSCLGGNWSQTSTTKELYCAKSCLGVFPKEYTSMVRDLCGLDTAASMLDMRCHDRTMPDEYQANCNDYYGDYFSIP